MKKVFIIAEASANHAQSFKLAEGLIKKAAACGADAIKFQAYTPDTMTLDVKNRYFGIKHPKWPGQTLYQLYKKAHAPWHWFKKLKQIADDFGIIFFSTVFDKTSVDLMQGLGVSLYKISSFELVDLPLIEYAAKTKKPLILSTGMASVREIKEAVSAAKAGGAKDITLLKCVSNYPALPGQMNLRAIPEMKKVFNCPIGLSDHTLGMAVSVSAVSLGAQVIEKHFTLSRKIKTADSFFSTQPRELEELVKNIRIAEEALGEPRLGPSRQEKESILFRRSLFAVRDIKKGEEFTEKNIKSLRPSWGLHPKRLKDILRKKAKKYIKMGEPLRQGMF